jgi:ketosteroid isomerase-like protein
MTTHPHAQLAERAYKAFAAGDMQTLDELMTEDLVWHIAGTSAISGTYEGKPAVFGFLQQLAERTGGTFSLDVHDIIADDAHAVALLHAYGERNGRQLDDEEVHVMHITDGAVTSFWSYAWDQEARNAFWA